MQDYSEYMTFGCAKVTTLLNPNAEPFEFGIELKDKNHKRGRNQRRQLKKQLKLSTQASRKKSNSI